MPTPLKFKCDKETDLKMVEELKCLRYSENMSQSQFAEKFRLQVSAYRAWEQGTRPIPVYILHMVKYILELEAVIKSHQ